LVIFGNTGKLTMSYRQNRRLEDSYTLKPLSRRSIIDKQRALAGAHNEAETKLGSLILRPSHDPIYQREVSRIEQDGHRVQTDLENRKKQLMKRLSHFPEPTVILRRPKKDLGDAISTSLPSLDAFTVKGRKTRNLWERKLLTPPNLLSIHVPCEPLSDEEQREIYLRNALLLPRPGTKGRQSTLKTRLSQPVQGSKPMVPGTGNVLLREPISAHPNLKSLRPSSKVSKADSVFVTEIPLPSRVLSGSEKTLSTSPSKTLRKVQFDDESIETVEIETARASLHPVIVVVHEERPEATKATVAFDSPRKDATEMGPPIAMHAMSDERMVRGVDG
jgi:hypothetical protein